MRNFLLGLRLLAVAACSYAAASASAPRGPSASRQVQGFVDAQRPSTPGGLVAWNVLPTSVNLSWSAATDDVGVVAYDVFRDGTLIGSSPIAQFAVTNLAPATACTFTVQARDAAENISDSSAPLAVTTGFVAANLAVKRGGYVLDRRTTHFVQQLSVANAGSAAAPGSIAIALDNLSAGVTLASGPGSIPGTAVLPPTPILLLDLGSTHALAPGATVSVNAEFAGPTSARITYDTRVLAGLANLDLQPPTAPTSLQVANLTATGFTATWHAATDNVGVTYYQVFLDGQLIATTPNTTCAPGGLQPAAVYALTVKALDAAGNVSAPSAVTTVQTPLPAALTAGGGLRLWLSAGWLPPGALAVWQDRSSLGNDAMQPAAGNQPTVIAGALNGQAVVRFNGTASYLTLPNVMAGATAGEIIVVNRLNAIPNTFNTVYGFGVDGFSSGLNNQSRFESFGTRDPNFHDAAAVELSGAPHVTDVSIDTAGTLQEYENNVLNWSRPDATPLGFATAPTLGQFLDGDIAEVIVYDHPLAAADRAAVIAYLDAKYRLLDHTPPDSPQNLVASNVTASSITLDWTAAADNVGVVAYDIYGGTTLLGSSTVASFTATGLTPGTAYAISVYARDLAGNVSSVPARVAVSTVALAAGAPSTISGLRLWLIPGTLTPGALARWADQSGRGNDATQASAPNQPTVVPSALNGQAVVRFDGTNSFLNLGDVMAGATAGEIVLVNKINFIPNTFNTVYAFGVGGYSSGINNQSRYESFGTQDPNFHDAAAVELAGAAHITEVSIDAAGNMQESENGLLNWSRTGATPLGFTPTPTLGQFLNGDIAEVIVYDHTLTAADRATLQAYLNGKYNVLDTTPPAAPAGLVAGNVTTSSLTLAWNPSTDNVGVTAYDVYNGSVLAGTTSATTLDINGLLAGTAYNFTVKARDLAGNNSAASNVLTVSTVAIVSGPPSALPGLRLWLLASTQPAGPLATWEDQSGRANPATQNFAAAQPTVVLNQLNGLPVVRFDGANGYMNLGAVMAGATAGEIIGVVRINNVPNTFNTLWGFGVDGFSSGINNQSRYESFGTRDPNFHDAAAVELSGNAHITDTSIDAAGNLAERANGVLNWSRTGATPLGFDPTPTLGQFLNGEIAELIVYDHVLSDAERDAIGAYLAGKYALPGITPPPAPTGLAATPASSTSVQLAWSSSAPAGLHTVALIERAANGGAFAEIAEAQDVSAYLDTGAATGTIYSYRVRLKGLAGTSDYSNSAVVNLGGGNHAPVATAQSVTVINNAPKTIVLSATDLDGDPLTYAVVTPPVHGTISGTVPAIVYTATAGYVGADTFTFKANDGHVDSAPAAVTIADVAPLAVAIVSPTASAAFSAPATITLTAAATAPSGQVAKVAYFQGGTEIGEATAAPFTVTWSNVATGTYVLTAQVTDQVGGATALSAPVTINVSAANTALLEIMMPTNGQTVTYARPSLGAHYAGTTPIQPDSFHIYLDGMNFSSEAMIENGEVMFMPKFNLAEGSHNYRIDWMSAGSVVATDNVNFIVNSVIAGGGTNFQGQVCDYNGAPLQNVKVTAAGVSTTTGSNGRYTFVNLPSGTTAFRFDTSNVPGPNIYAPVTLEFEVLAGHNTVWDRPVYLPIVDQSKGVLVHSDWPSDQVVTNPDIPGVKITIPAGTTVTFPDGKAAEIVTLINIPVYRSPNCLGPGVDPVALYATQPENTQLSQPASLEMPNALNAPEGSSLELWNLNKQTGRYSKTGVLQVIGGVVRSAPGSGLATFDWHGPRPVFPIEKDPQHRQEENKKDPNQPVCSYSDIRTGSLKEDHSIPAYSSVGTDRTLTLHYSSSTAAPVVSVSSKLYQDPTTGPGGMVRFGIATSFGSGATIYYNPNRDIAPAGYNVSATLDAKNAKTGNYLMTSSAAAYFTVATRPTGFASSAGSQTSQITIVNGRDLYPAMPLGWCVGNVDKLAVQDSGDVIKVGGLGDVTHYTRIGVVGNALPSNLGFELGTLDGFSYSGNQPSVVPSLGFINAPEGSKMALLQASASGVPSDASIGPAYQTLGTKEPGPRAQGRIRKDGLDSSGAGLFLPIATPVGGSNISFDLDLLTTNKQQDIGAALVIRYATQTRTGVGSITATPRHYGPIATILPGGDSGYGWRTGFVHYSIDVPKNLSVDTVAAGLIIDIETGGTIKAGDIAALVDNIVITNPSGVPAGATVYGTDTSDFSTFLYDPSSRHYVQTYLDGEQDVFDSAGQQLSHADRWNNTTRYTYVDATGNGSTGDLATITDPVGLVTALTYTEGKLSRVTDPMGRSTSLMYSGNFLSQIVNPDGTHRAFTYDGSGRLLSQSDGNDHTRTYSYSSAGRLASVTRADGSTYDYISSQERGLAESGTGDFDHPASTSAGRAAQSVDPRGSVTSSVIDQDGNLTSETDAVGNTTTRTYDPQRNLVSETGPMGNVTTTQRDPVGNPIQVTQSLNGATVLRTYGTAFNLLTSTTNALGFTTSYAYDTSGNLIKITDALGNIMQFTYNARGQVTSTTDQVGNTSTVTYDSLGRKSVMTDQLGHTISYTYDESGNVATITDANGHVTTMTYDLANDLVQRTAGDGGITKFYYDGNHDLIKTVDPLGHETLTAYDSRRRKISVTDALGQVTTFAYDGADNMILKSDAAGGKWTYSYDAANRLIASTDSLNNVTQFAYDANGNLVQTTRADGSVLRETYDSLNRHATSIATDGTATAYGYDLADQQTQVTDALGGIFRTSYDALGRVRATTDQLSRTTTRTYDAKGNVTGVQRPDGGFTQYTFDRANRLTQTTELDGGIVLYGYDNAGNLTSLTDPNGHTRSRGYDAVNRKAFETDALGRTRSYAYDLAGNFTSETRPDGSVITRRYDALNRLIQANLPALNNVPADTQTFTYDVLGNISGAADSDSAVTASYDALSRLKLAAQTFNGNTQSLSLAYDGLSRRTSRTDSAGVTSYAYDSRDRLTQITDPYGHAFQLGYDALSRLTSIQRANGVNTTQTFDAASQLLSIVHAKGGATLDGVTYTYNTVGNRAAETRADGNTRTHTYDPIDRLTAATSTLGTIPSETFTYDHEGNRTTPGRTYDGADELTSDGTYAYTYDAEGNMSTRTNVTNPADVTYYLFDALDRLVRVTSPTTVSEHFYDATGRRIGKRVNGVMTRFVYDGANANLEFDGANHVTAVNTYLGLDSLLARTTAAGTVYPLLDAQRSTISLTDASGLVTERYRYDSFGLVRILASDFSPRAGEPQLSYTYTGREWEPDAKTYFCRARFYSPTVATWLSRDPAGEAAGINLYAYCHGNPVNERDPDGGWAGVDDAIAIGVGAAVGAIGQGVSDLFRGHLSPWQKYAAAVAGGAAGGEVTLWSGPILGGIAAGAVTNGTGQALNLFTGQQQGFSGSSLIQDATLGGIGAFAGSIVIGTAVRFLPSSIKGNIGEAVSYTYNRLQGARFVGSQVKEAFGTRTTADFIFENGGIRYIVEAKFGVSDLKPAQIAAREVLGDLLYQEERWDYNWVARVGGFFGFGATDGWLNPCSTQSRTQ